MAGRDKPVELHLVQTSASTFSVQVIVDVLDICLNGWSLEFTREEAEARLTKLEKNYRAKGYRNIEVNRRKAHQYGAGTHA